MLIQFIELEIGLLPAMAELEAAIATRLQQHGEPLRWAITQIDPVRQIAHIEAVVTVGDFTHPHSVCSS